MTLSYAGLVTASSFIHDLNSSDHHSISFSQFFVLLPLGLKSITDVE